MIGERQLKALYLFKKGRDPGVGRCLCAKTLCLILRIINRGTIKRVWYKGCTLALQGCAVEDVKRINAMNRQDEMHKDTEKWESRELGASEIYARRADIDLNALDESLGLKPISIRLQQGIPCIHAGEDVKKK